MKISLLLFFDTPLCSTKEDTLKGIHVHDDNSVDLKLATNLLVFRLYRIEARHGGTDKMILNMTLTFYVFMAYISFTNDKSIYDEHLL